MENLIEQHKKITKIEKSIENTNSEEKTGLFGYLVSSIDDLVITILPTVVFGYAAKNFAIDGKYLESAISLSLNLPYIRYLAPEIFKTGNYRDLQAYKNNKKSGGGERNG